MLQCLISAIVTLVLCKLALNFSLLQAVVIDWDLLFALSNKERFICVAPFKTTKNRKLADLTPRVTFLLYGILIFLAVVHIIILANCEVSIGPITVCTGG